MGPIYIELTEQQKETLRPFFDVVNREARDPQSSRRWAILAQPLQHGDTTCHLIDPDSIAPIREIVAASIKAQKEEAERQERIARLKCVLNVSRVVEVDNSSLNFVHEGFKYVVTEVGAAQ